MNDTSRRLAPPDHFDESADLVIVGGGGTGLAAAVRGGELGARVVLFEKNPHLGGTTGIAVGSMTACCTSMQKAEGIEDSPEAHNEDIGKFHPGLESRSNNELRLFFTRNSGATIEWLRRLGVQYHGPISEPPNRVPRMHNIVPNAKAYVAVMHRHAMRFGVDIRIDSLVEALYLQDGRVLGVRVRTADGKYVSVKAERGVVLATGDFSSNVELKRQYISEAAAEIEGINPMATGEGQLLGIAAGAALHNMDVMLGPQIRFVPPPRPPFAQMLPTTPLAAKLMSLATGLMPSFVFQHIVKSLLVTWQHPEPMLFEAGAILINKSGERFINELDEPAYGIPTQQDKVAWIIFDQTIAEKFSAWPHYISTAPGISYAYVKDYKRLRPDVYAEADTLAALASQIGVPAAGLEAAAAKNDGDDAFGREHFGSGLGKPPFHALGPAKGWIVITEGGLAINDKLQVLDNDNRPIPGLYAGGTGAQGGMIIWGHGLHICWAVTSGRLAAENAAG
tara:strand:+ start:716 stop:2236 length:1521 start_codon:yes stop_codon:yes gene_type:complete